MTIIFLIYLAICIVGVVWGYMRRDRDRTDGYFWIGILLYLITMFWTGYLFWFKLPNDIAGDEPEACSPSPGTQYDDDNSTKFFINQIDKCDIGLSPANRTGLKRLFWLLGIFILAIEIIILLLLFPWARDKANRVKAGIGSAGRMVSGRSKSRSGSPP